MRKFVTRVILLCASCIILLSCNSPEATKKDGNQELEIAEEAKQAYIYATNLEVWNGVLIGSYTYSEIIGKEISESDIFEVYREKTIDPDLGDEIYLYYFMNVDLTKGSILSYSIMKKKWGTMFGRIYQDEFLSNDNLEFVGEINVTYPKSYFPTPCLTEYKKSCLEEIKRYIEKYLKDYFKKGNFQIFIMDFSDADNETLIMIQNAKKKMHVIPMNITDVDKSGPHVEVRSNVITPEFKKDYDLGGINYSDLFTKLSVLNYTLEIE